MASHILWQNVQKTVTLLDIPRSIVEAQGFNSPDSHALLSSKPREMPYPSSEPKSAKAKAKLVDNTVDQELHSEYRELLTQAMREVSQHHTGDWCLSRPFVEETRPQKKRKLDEVADDDGNVLPASRPIVQNVASMPDHLLSNLARTTPGSGQVRFKHPDADPSTLPDANGGGDLNTRYRSNDSDEHPSISIAEMSEPGSQTFDFLIPTRSCFYLGDCTDSHNFRKAFRQHARRHGSRSTFDFILLDPPWPNRSIKRTHKSGGVTYRTIPTLDDLGTMIFDMQLDTIMAENALLGVWITNMQAARELVLGLGGLFECCGVDFTEEWIWLKTTTSGDPTSVLDAQWKKPYEVLLLGRRRDVDIDHKQNETKPTTKRRVIVAVPDLHSRKPCLKRLIEPLLPNSENYTALEVFSRHLVAGWCSWGDECIKFNWDGYWNKQRSLQ